MGATRMIVKYRVYYRHGTFEEYDSIHDALDARVAYMDCDDYYVPGIMAMLNDGNTAWVL